MRAAYSVAPTPQASAPEAPPMQVCESVAWTKSPGSISCSRATWWQMPGDTPVPSARPLDLVGDRAHRGDPGGVDQVPLDPRDPRRVGEPVAGAVLVGE